MYFNTPENRIFTPLKNAHKGGTGWQKAYQSVKHSRVESFDTKAKKKPTIRYLIRALAALYLLNVYYTNYDSIKVVDKIAYLPIETPPLPRATSYRDGIDLSKLDLTFGSKFFQVCCIHNDGVGIMESGNLNVESLTKDEKERVVVVPIFSNTELKLSGREIRHLYDELEREEQRRTEKRKEGISLIITLKQMMSRLPNNCSEVRRTNLCPPTQKNPTLNPLL